MKPKHIVYTVLGVIAIGLMAVMVYALSPKNEEIYAYSIYGYNEGIVIGTHKVKKIERLNRTDTVIHVLDDAEFFEAMKKSQYFISECDIKCGTRIRHGCLYYYNNNSYFLYQVQLGVFYLVNLYGHISFQIDPAVSYAFPVYTDISVSLTLLEESDIEKIVSDFFSLFDYEAAKQFYQVYKNGFVAYDDENQVIKVKGYNEGVLSSYPCIVLDYLNKNIGYADKTDNIIWLLEAEE